MSDKQKPYRSHFHSAETAIHQRLGISESISKKTQALIRDYMPQQHRDFFEQLPIIIIATTDHHGQPWATPICGAPSFITSPDSNTLLIHHLPPLHNVLQLEIQAEKKIGILGIDLSTRRRNRMNGIIKKHSPLTLAVHVEHSFGNCKKYIHFRDIVGTPVPRHIVHKKETTQTEIVTQAAHHIIQRSDTFFIASRTQHINDDVRHGLDASHRGGKAGFVTIKNNHTLCFPDFKGNRFFNTLGNIESDQRVGLLFIDFETGDCLCISGTATIFWDIKSIKLASDIERLIEVNVQRVIHIPQLVPFTYTSQDQNSQK